MQIHKERHRKYVPSRLDKYADSLKKIQDSFTTLVVAHIITMMLAQKKEGACSLCHSASRSVIES